MEGVPSLGEVLIGHPGHRPREGEGGPFYVDDDRLGINTADYLLEKKVS